MGATYDNGTAGVGATLTFGSTISAIDGVTLSNGDRILVLGYTGADEPLNGIYTRTSGTVWTRSTDFDTAAEIAGGDFVFNTEGTIYNNTGWVQTNNVATVGTDDVIFQQFSGAGTYTAGIGLSLSGSTFNVNLGAVS